MQRNLDYSREIELRKQQTYNYESGGSDSEALFQFRWRSAVAAACRAASADARSAAGYSLFSR